MATIAFQIDMKYILIGISEALATTYKKPIVINGVHKGQFTFQPITKGKKKTFYLSVNDQMVFEGTQLPFTTDYDGIDEGFGNCFTGNAMFNLVANGSKLTIEQVRVFIEENNINGEADLSRVLYHEVPVFPELCPNYVIEKFSEA